MKLRQVELRSVGKPTKVQVVWVDATLKFTPTCVVIGRDKREWRVIQVYSTVVDSSEIHSDWNVGGLL